MLLTTIYVACVASFIHFLPQLNTYLKVFAMHPFFIKKCDGNGIFGIFSIVAYCQSSFVDFVGKNAEIWITFLFLLIPTSGVCDFQLLETFKITAFRDWDFVISGSRSNKKNYPMSARCCLLEIIKIFSIDARKTEFQINPISRHFHL